MTPPEERLTVRGPEDILGFIPHSLGYWPAQSLVAMTLQGKRLGATLRLDLPAPDAPGDPVAFAATVCSYLAADRQADGTLLALFTTDGWPGRRDCYDGLLSILRSALADAGVPVRDAWYVGDLYWRDACCADLKCCPLPGRPIQQIRDSMLNTEMVFRGSSVGPAPGHRRDPAKVPALHRAAVAEAEAAWSAAFGPRRESRAQFQAVLDRWHSLLLSPPEGVQELPGDLDAFLRASLLVPAWRDAVLVMAAAGKAAAVAGAEQFGIFSDGPGLEAVQPTDGLTREGKGLSKLADLPPAFLPQLADGTAPATSDTAGVPGYGDVLMGLQPAPPNWCTLDALDLVLERLADLGGPAAAAALTGRGWIAWCRGRGSFAAAYLAEALEVEPGYRLAELLLELVRRGTLSGWATHKDSAWQKFGPAAA